MMQTSRGQCPGASIPCGFSSAGSLAAASALAGRLRLIDAAVSTGADAVPGAGQTAPAPASAPAVSASRSPVSHDEKRRACTPGMMAFAMPLATGNASAERRAGGEVMAGLGTSPEGVAGAEAAAGSSESKGVHMSTSAQAAATPPSSCMASSSSGDSAPSSSPTPWKYSWERASSAQHLRMVVTFFEEHAAAQAALKRCAERMPQNQRQVNGHIVTPLLEGRTLLCLRSQAPMAQGVVRIRLGVHLGQRATASYGSHSRKPARTCVQVRAASRARTTCVP